jgi:NAD(P)H dehydrogenase (quinone)
MSIGITGATGQLGRIVVGKLKNVVATEEIVALVRTPSKAADLGVAAREADYTQPDELVKALKGIDVILLISSNEIGQRAVQHKNVIEAAKKAGVKRIVYTSLLHADTSILGLADEHRSTEADLKASGVPFTILRNGWYTENYTGSIPGALAGGAFLGSAKDGRIASAARADYAEAAVKVLTESGHTGKTYELSGDDAYTLSDLAAELSKQVGRDIPYTDLSEAEYAATLVKFGVPEGFAPAIAGWDAAAAHGALFDNSRQLSSLIGHPTTSLATVIADAVKSAK